MMQIVREIPEALKALGEAGRAMVRQVAAAWRRTRGGKALEYTEVERQLAEGAAAIERAGHQAVRQGLEVDPPRVAIEGKGYARVGRHAAAYYTMAGPVVGLRSLDREVGQRTAKTVTAVSLRAGAVAEVWLPGVAQAMAYQLQQGTAREAEATAHRLGRLPYSRSRFARVGQAVGTQYTGRHAAIEEGLSEGDELPAAARSVSVALDRVSIPMEEALTEAERVPPPGEPARQVGRQFRRAYCATVTLHDREGQAVHTVRYGRMPQGDIASLCARLADEVRTLLRKRPTLQVRVLADGAPELWKLLERELNQATLGVPVHRLIDLWHLLEKLGRAARVLSGEVQASAVLPAWRLRLLNRSRTSDEILAELYHSGKEEVSVGTSRPVHEAITYLENHRPCLNYAGARRRGLPVGSGNVEATCKSLVALRLTRPGARWQEETGEQILQLRALALSDRWEAAMVLTLKPLRKAVRVAA
jgi:hypothetical protein